MYKPIRILHLEGQALPLPHLPWSHLPPIRDEMRRTLPCQDLEGAAQGLRKAQPSRLVQS